MMTYNLYIDYVTAVGRLGASVIVGPACHVVDRISRVSKILV